MGPLICRVFSILDITVLHNPRMVESAGAEPQIRRDSSEVILGFSTALRSSPLTPAFFRGMKNVFQGFSSFFLEEFGKDLC